MMQLMTFSHNPENCESDITSILKHAPKKLKLLTPPSQVIGACNSVRATFIILFNNFPAEMQYRTEEDLERRWWKKWHTFPLRYKRINETEWARMVPKLDNLLGKE